MPILVEPDSTTAGVLTSALPGGAQVVARADEVDGWLNGRGEYAVVIGPTLDLEDGDDDRRAGAQHAPRHQRGADPARRSSTEVLRPGHAGRHRRRGGGRRPQRARHRRDAGAEHLGGASTAPRRPTVSATARSSRSSPPRAGSARPRWRSTWRSRSPTTARDRVCLVDLDLAFGDVAITMQLIPEHTIAEAIGAEELLDFSMVEGLLTRHERSCMVLAAPTAPGRPRPGVRHADRAGCSARCSRSSTTSWSTPRRASTSQVLRRFDETDECVIVATLDVPTLKNVKVAIETLDLLNIATGHRHLVLNRPTRRSGSTTANVEDDPRRCRSPCRSPRSTDVASATNHGTPIVLSKPNHPASRAIRELGRRLVRPSSATPTWPSRRAACSDAEEARGRRSDREVTS